MDIQQLSFGIRTLQATTLMDAGWKMTLLLGFRDLLNVAVIFWLIFGTLIGHTQEVSGRFGLGYSNIEGTTTLEKPLRWIGAASGHAAEQDIPKSCFEPPGITHVFGRKVSSYEEVTRLFWSILNVAPIGPTIRCGNDEVNVDIVYEVSEDKTRWLKATAIPDRLAVHILKSYISTLVKDPDSNFRLELDDASGVLRLFGTDGTRWFQLLVENHQVIVAIDNRSSIVQDTFYEDVVDEGLSAKKLDKNEEGMYRTAVFLGPMKPWELHEERMRIYDKSLSLSQRGILASLTERGVVE